MEYRVFTTDEYDDWLDEQTARSRVQIADRLDKVRDHGYFGDHKPVGDNVFELRWKNGRRVYYSLIPEKQVLLLLGGNKNGQSKDIHQAEKISKEWIND